MASDVTRVLHVVVPSNIDDPRRPSGGNRYDRRVCDELVAAGWAVHEHKAPGDWPGPSPDSVRRLGALLMSIPDRATVLVDGLIASNAPEVLVPVATRTRVVILLHTPLVEMSSALDVAEAHHRESAVLAAAHGVVATSRWTRERLIDRYSLSDETVTVAEPGADPAELAAHSRGGSRFLCVASVAPHKGQDLVIDALAKFAHRDWTCRFVGPLDTTYANRLRAVATDADIDGRIEFCGSLDRTSLETAYAAADLLVHGSRYETYGMVVTEALARGVPVVATRVGGVPDAMGVAANGRAPGMLVPPNDPVALAAALRDWLESAELRAQLRAAAADRRQALPSWSTTALHVARAVVTASVRAEVPA